MSDPPSAPCLRQYFGSPPAHDDVFSQLADSAMMASQASLVQVAARAAPVQATPPGPPGPPQLLQVSEHAPDVEEAFRHELQDALDYEERRPRFSIGPEAADEVDDLVAEMQRLHTGDSELSPSHAATQISVSSQASAWASQRDGGDTFGATMCDATRPSPPDIQSTDTSADFDDATQEVEEVSLADDGAASRPSLAPDNFMAQSVSSDLDMPVSPDDPGMSGDTCSLLPNTEMDRQYDAWIPSDPTQTVLNSMSQSLPGTFYPSRDNLTLPGCSLQTDLTDPVSELMMQYMPSADARQRSVLTADSVTQDDRGIRQLVQAGCYRAAVNLTSRLLANYGQGYGRVGQVSKHTANSVQLWFTRLALLVRLRQFSVAEREAQAWGDLDTADLFFQYYPDLYGGRRGSLVPFSFRVLLAELPRYMGQYETSLDRLYQIHTVCEQILANLAAGRSEDGSTTDLSASCRRQSVALWTSRRRKVIFSVVNCCVGMKDYEQATECLDRLTAELPESSAGLLSAAGRVYLQLGNLTAARAVFSAVGDQQLSADGGDDRLTAQLLINEAFLAIGDNNFAEAQTKLERALQLEPHNATVLTNLSVCLLYRGLLTEAVTTLESAVFSRPDLLQETVLLNLCTLYELQTSKCNMKKVALLSRVGSHKGDGFNVSCLKLQSAS